MRTVKRVGVFETNSSSMHSMYLVSKDELQNDAVKEEYKNYRRLENKEDKLLMACGCAHEIFPEEEEFLNRGHQGDVTYYKYAKPRLEAGMNMYFDTRHVTYELASFLIVGVYCELTGKDFKTVLADIDGKNKSRKCRSTHFNFFEETALHEAEYDYGVIYRFFWEGFASDIRKKIAQYFSDDAFLMYNERWF